MDILQIIVVVSISAVIIYRMVRVLKRYEGGRTALYMRLNRRGNKSVFQIKFEDAMVRVTKVLCRLGLHHPTRGLPCGRYHCREFSRATGL